MQQNNFGWASLFGVGGQDDDLWTEEERKRLQRARMQAMGSGLLEASGWSSTPVTFGQAWANASGRGQEAQQYAEAGLMQRRQMTAEQAAQKQRQEAEAAFLQGLTPQQQQLAKVMGVGPFAKEQMGQHGKIAAEGAKRTALQREAEQMYPGDTAKQAAWIQQVRAKPIGTTVNVGGQGVPQDPAQRFVTPEQRAVLQSQGIDLPEGPYVWDKNGMPQRVEGPPRNAAQEKVDASNNAKAPDVQNANMLFDQMEQLLDQGVQTGPISGSQIAGVPLGRMVDYDRKTLFDAFVKQVSPSLRAVFRIPGEGALSDSEQKQYGLMLPSVEYPESVNRQLMANLRIMLQNKTAGQPEAADDDELINKYLGG